MKKQKICIIGGSLTGLVTAISLSKLNCEIDLITNNLSEITRTTRTIAISESNLNFLKKLNIFKSSNKEFWPCSVMKLYTKTSQKKFMKIFEINNSKKKKKILYMLENSKITKLMLNKIKKIKSISIKNNRKINEINNAGLLKSIKFNNNEHKYNLIIVCSGSNSNLVKNIFDDQFIENSYNETSITTILNHSSFKNNIVRQIFFNSEILALLPISNNRTSVVWSVKNNVYNINKLNFKKKIKSYANEYLKNIQFKNIIEYRKLNSLIRKRYYHNRILLFGDALHSVHPFVGQGFNMTLRDLLSLENTLSNKINLGLDIGSSDILSEFSNETKPRNFAYSMGIDLIKNSFSLKNKNFQKIRNNIIKILNKSNFMKDISINIADKGFKF